MPRTRCLVKSGNIRGVRAAQSTAGLCKVSCTSTTPGNSGALLAWGASRRHREQQTEAKPSTDPNPAVPKCSLNSGNPVLTCRKPSTKCLGNSTHSEPELTFKIILNWLMSTPGLLTMNNSVLSALTSETSPSLSEGALCTKQELSSQSTPCAHRGSSGNSAEL